MRSFLAPFLFLILLGACSEGDGPYSFPKTPVGEVPQPDHNPSTVQGVALGEKLFFDPLLSKNVQISCASCHVPRKAFSDGVALSHIGVSNEQILRHSPALFNLAWMEGTFWDGGAKNLESQVFGPLLHPDEMAADPKVLIARLSNHPVYPNLFKKVWGSDSITTVLIARSLAQYERTLLSFNSKYDKWKAGETQLDSIELRGYGLYKENCSSCHTEGLFTDNRYHNNGLDPDSVILMRDHEQLYMGRYRISLDTSDIGRYKTPSLRNLGFTAPYMHDGRIKELNDVLKHYSSGIDSSMTLDKQIPYSGFDLNQDEKNQLLRFLHTLNDTAFTQLDF